MTKKPLAIARNHVLAHWIILAGALLGILGISGYFSYQEFMDADARERDRLMIQSRVIADNLGRQLQAAHLALLGVREDMHVWRDGRGWAAATRRLKALCDAMPGVRTILITDAAGTVLASNREQLIGQNFSQRDYFKAAKERPDTATLYVSPPFRTTFEVFAMNVGVMLAGTDNSFAGVISATLEPEFFTNLLASVRYAPDMWSAIAHGDGLQFLMSPERPGMGGMNLAQPGSFFTRHTESGRQENLLTGIVQATGEERMMALRTIQPAAVPMDKPLVVAVGRKLDAIHAPWREKIQFRGGLLAVMAVMSALGLLIYQRRQREFDRRQARADADLRTGAERLKLAAEAAGVGVWEWDLASDRLTWDPAMLAMYGLDPTQFKPTYEAWSGTLLPEDLPRVEDELRLAIATGTPFDSCFRIRRRDGEIRQLQVKSHLVLDQDGQPSRLVGINEDITERLLAEEKFRLIADYIHDWEYWLSHQRELLFVSPSSEKITGYSPEEFKANIRLLDQIIHPEDRPLWKQHHVYLNLDDSSRHGEESIEFRIIAKNGDVRWISHRCRPVFRADGAFLGRRVSNRDITERKQAEDSIRILAKFPDENPDPVLRISAQGIITYANQACLRSFGAQVIEQGRPAPAFLGRVLEQGQGYRAVGEFEAEVEGRIYLFSSSPISEMGEVYIYGRDVTARKQLEHQRQMAGTVFDNSVEGIIIAAPDGKVQMVNAAYTAITGFSAQEIIGTDVDVFRSEKEDPVFFEELWEALAGQGRWSGEYWNRRKNGEAYPEWLSLILVKDLRGHIANIVVIFHDITDTKNKEERIKHQAYHDALTGLPNRALFIDRLGQAIAHAEREATRLAVVFLDLDNFKRVNDSLGHHMGDLLLQQTAKRLQECLREGDTISRLGGDEFTIILPDVGRIEDALDVANRILRSMERPFHIQGNELFITTSMGITFCPDDAKDGETLIKNADLAMYRAKDEGRNNLQLFTSALNIQAQHRLRLESQLRQALDRREFIVHYQPKVALASGSIVGMEALVRWRRPGRGLVMPGEFIALSEDTGLILPLGEQVLRQACQEAQAWRLQGHPHLCVSVNLSPRQFEQKNLVEMVEGILQETGLPSVNLELEITEGAVMKNVDKAMARLVGLASMGVRLSLDDFGTGYSSLSYLKRFSISALKVDQSFVRDMTHDPNDAAIVQTIIAMGHALELQVVAEGVETAEQLAFLRAHGCDEYQGYYFSRPIPAAEFQVLLEKGA